MKKLNLSIAALGLGILAVGPANAQLNVAYQFNGLGNWSIDAVGSNSTPVGTLSALVPAGSIVQKAYLYSSTYGQSANIAIIPQVDFDGTTYLPTDFTALPKTGNGNFLQAFRADVTSQVSTKVGGGGGTFNFVVNREVPNANIDGEMLVVIYSNPAELTRTIAVLDGAGQVTGSTTFFNFANPVNTTQSGFEALMSLGIGFGFQPSSQSSIVDVNGRRLTSSAGGQDDGGGFNGGLITAGGLGDSSANPGNPNAGPNVNANYDDELYDLAQGNGLNPNGFINNGDTQIRIDTVNASQDDLIFFLGLNVTAKGNVNHDPTVPEPGAVALLAGLAVPGVQFLVRRRRK